MKKFLHRFWSWLCVVFCGQKNLCDLKNDIQETIKKTTPKKRKKVRRGKLIWDSRKTGTYRRHTPKTGRNAVCPCGAMRTAPRDETKPAKFKHCCGTK